MQFLWGVRQIAPPKIMRTDVSALVAGRLMLVILLGVLGVGVNGLGRCEPASPLLAMALLHRHRLLLLRHDKFLLAWGTIAALLLDLVWLSLAS